jgi:hypothetical protein
VGSGGTPILLQPGQPGPMSPDEYKPASVANVATFAFEHIAPPSPLYIQRDDQLVVLAKSSIGGETVTFNVRMLLVPFAQGSQPDVDQQAQEKAAALAAAKAAPAGKIVRVPLGPGQVIAHGVIEPSSTQLVLPTTFTGQFIQVPLTEGYLLAVAANVLAANARGQTFVRAYVQRGAASLALTNAFEALFGDYCTINGPIGWPNGRLIFPTEGPGNLRSITVTPPGAGNEWSLAVPLGARWAIRSISSTLVTSAAVANRTPTLVIKDNSVHTLFQAGNNNNQAASVTDVYSYGPGVAIGQSGPTAFQAAIPDALVLPGQFTIGSLTTNLQAGDAWGPIQVEVEEWIDGF